MAAAVVVAGATLIRTGTGAANALEDLGYSINGVRIFEDVFTGDVPGDQNGGDAGPPIDVQYFGQVDRVEIEMSKFDAAVIAKIAPRLLGGSAGTIGTAGTLIAAGSKYYRLLLTATNFTRNYLCAVPRAAIETNWGTKFTMLRLVFDCYAFGGTLYNTTTSG